MTSLIRRIWRAAIRRCANRMITRVCRWEYETQRFRRHNERAVEFAFLFSNLAKLAPKSVLDVGTGQCALPAMVRYCGCLVTATDNIRDYWRKGMSNRHWWVVNDDICDTTLEEGQFEFIACISVLEHIKKPDAAIASMYKSLAPGGYLVLTFPYNERRYEPNVYDLPGSAYGQGAPYVCQSYSRTELDRWEAAHSWKIVEQKFWQFWSGEVWTIGEQIMPPREVGAEDAHQHTCLLLRKGAGA